VFSLGIWKFSKNIENAKQFIRYHFEEKNFGDGLAAAGAYNLSPLPYFEKHPVFTEDPKLAAIQGSAKYQHLDGWPGPADRHANQVSHLYIIPNMYAKACTGTSTKEAMKWAQAEIEKIYSS
jgi:hypothetical protein